MPPAKAKKLTPKQQLAAAEARIAHLAAEMASKERELGDTIARLATTLAEYKAIIFKQNEQLESGFDVREKRLQVELAAAKSRIAELERVAVDRGEAAAAASTAEAERQVLLRQVAEAVASREAAERAHVAEVVAVKQGMVSLRLRLEEKFKDALESSCAAAREQVLAQMGSDNATAVTEVMGLRALAARHARELAGALHVAQTRNAEIHRLVRGRGQPGPPRARAAPPPGANRRLRPSRPLPHCARTHAHTSLSHTRARARFFAGANPAQGGGAGRRRGPEARDGKGRPPKGAPRGAAVGAPRGGRLAVRRQQLLPLLAARAGRGPRHHRRRRAPPRARADGHL
jgi:hypothetical protein